MSPAPGFPLLHRALADFGLYWLVLGRVGGALLVAPVIGTGFVPNTVKAAIVAVVSLALLPAVRPPAGGVPQGFLPYAGLELQEVALGLAIGYIARLALAAAEMAGGLMDMQLGFGITAAIDPLLAEPSPVIGTFFSLLLMTAFLVAGGDRLLIEALAASFTRLPVGGATGLLTAGPAAALDAFAWMFATGLEVAAPLLGLMFVGTLLLGLLSRAVPQLNVLATGMPVQVLAGVGALMLMIPAVFAAMQALVPRSFDFLARLAGG
jgi:flagellar biosynthetic protein FliR